MFFCRWDPPMRMSIGRQLVSACWPLANTLTVSSHTGQAGRVGFGCGRSIFPLPLFHVCGEHDMGHLSYKFLFLKLLCSLPYDSNEGQACVFVCAQAHTHTGTPTGRFAILNPSASFIRLQRPRWGPVGVFSGVAGADGGGARARVPAVADTGRETDEDGHRARCSGGDCLSPGEWGTDKSHPRLQTGEAGQGGTGSRGK